MVDRVVVLGQGGRLLEREVGGYRHHKLLQHAEISLDDQAGFLLAQLIVAEREVVGRDLPLIEAWKLSAALGKSPLL